MSKFSNRIMSRLPGKELLHNRGILYALCAVALLQIVMYGSVKDFNSIIMLLIIGFLVSFFNKNMIVVLGVSIVATYALNYVSYSTISEGAENMDEPAPGEADLSKEASADAVDNIASGQASLAEQATATSPDDQKTILINGLQNDFKEFQKIQESILSGMKEIDPLLTKAEKFISKFEYYSSKMNEDSKKLKDDVPKE